MRDISNHTTKGIVFFSGDGYWLRRVDPETICQYTGSTDKNGVKIFEGDIVSISAYSYTEPEDDYFGVVEYIDSLGCWCLTDGDNNKPIPMYECVGSYKTEGFVLGNRFDNPDLLKGDTDE